MIAIISFKDRLFLPEEEAIALKLRYNDNKDLRVGIKDNVLQSMWSGDYYKDELTYYDDTKEWKKADGKTVSNYDVYTRPAKADYVEVHQEKQLVDLEWFMQRCKYKFYIEQAVTPQDASVAGIQRLLEQVENKVFALSEAVEAVGQHTFNQRCNVHVGGGLIVTYNDLMLKEDCCTDELQCELNNGWRIIAVCAQPDQRRPDYVLGRFTPQLDVNHKREADR